MNYEHETITSQSRVQNPLAPLLTKEIKRLEKGKRNTYGFFISKNPNGNMTFTYGNHYQLVDYVLHFQIDGTVISQKYTSSLPSGPTKETEGEIKNDMCILIHAPQHSKERSDDDLSSPVLIAYSNLDIYAYKPEFNDYFYFTGTFINKDPDTEKMCPQTISIIVDRNVSDVPLTCLTFNHATIYNTIAMESLFRRYHENA